MNEPLGQTAIFLGAGASKAEGAPLQGDLFRDYFSAPIDNLEDQSGPGDALRIRRQLAAFFQVMFLIDVDGDLNNTTFPTFEEALGILDLAELRRESLRGVPENPKELRESIVLAMAAVIKRKLAEPARIDLHKRMVENLGEEMLRSTVFLTTNYDILLDIALKGLNGKRIDYGLDFDHRIKNADLIDSHLDAVKLFKLHGSLNWLYCSTCNGIAIIRGKADLISNIERCARCSSKLGLIIIPPTFFKDMSKVFLGLVWNKAERALQDVRHMIFCGYSFPDADLHLKYLLKRVQTNRASTEPKVRFTVVSHYDYPPKEKPDEEAREEKARYFRFLGDQVKFTKHTFEEFANDPQKFYNGSNLTLYP